LTRQLIFRPRAHDELDALVRYIAQDNPEAATRLAHAVFEALERVVFRPEAFPELDIAATGGQRYRKVAPPGFPNHLVLYRVLPEAVEVHHVVHASRDLPTALRDDPTA
jgi:plasmid stabilization system protein ParE